MTGQSSHHTGRGRPPESAPGRSEGVAGESEAVFRGWGWGVVYCQIGPMVTGAILPGSPSEFRTCWCVVVIILDVVGEIKRDLNLIVGSIGIVVVKALDVIV